MYLNRIILTLATLAIISSSSGGYLYFNGLRSQADHHAHIKAMSSVRAIANRISIRMTERQQSLDFISRISTLSTILAEGGGSQTEKEEKVNLLLDGYRESMQADACYLMNGKGITIATSNRNTAESFLNKDYSFRPYFQSAIKGRPAVYMAIGVTSGKRGIYFSHPVYVSDQPRPAGIIVAKFATTYIDMELSLIDDGVSLLVDPHGIIFSSSNPAWLNKALWPLSDKDREELAATKQFGQGPWEWSGATKSDHMHVSDRDGKMYLMHQAEIVTYPEWKIVYLHDLSVVSAQIFTPLFKMAGGVILLLCLLIGFISALLYRRATLEIQQRIQAEEEVHRLNRDLEKIVTDRTDQLRETQEQLMRRQKLAVLGQLAGTVAHDLRNPLGAISNVSYLLHRDMLDKSCANAEKHLEILDKAVHKAESITSELLQFSRTTPPRPTRNDLNAIINECLGETEIPKHITLTKELFDNLPPTLVDPTFFCQMLANLISNALQFMPKGGTLTIATRVGVNGNEIQISDTGPGIPEENLTKIFEPLFTTRASGIGLGLAIVKDIVTRHNGTIQIISDAGQGTTFSIILPIA